MALLSYMQRRRSGTYEFRRRLPEALSGKHVPAHMREAFPELVNPRTGRFKRELVRSLRTKEPHEAKRQDHREAQKVGELFDDALQAIASGPSDGPSKVPTAVNLEAIETEVLAELLAGDETEREEGDDRRQLQTAEDRAKWPDLEPPQPHSPAITIVPADRPFVIPDPAARGMAPDHFLIYGDHLEEFAAEYRAALARRDPSIVKAETQTVLRRRGIPIPSDRSTSPLFRAVGMAVLQAHVRAYDEMLRRQKGDVVPTPALPREEDRGPKLSEAFATWRAGGGGSRGAKKPSTRTADEAEQVVRMFRELHGDLRLGDITREKARLFRDALAKVPTRLPPRLRKLPLPKLLERDLSKFPVRGAATVNKLLTLISAVVSRVEADGFLERMPSFANPFRRIRVPVDDAEAGGRDLFTPADLGGDLLDDHLHARGAAACGRRRGGVLVPAHRSACGDAP